jgi:hypothetical protein
MSWIIKEFLKMLPAACFFLVAFSLVDATDRIINKGELSYYSFFSCIAASLIMGKVVLITDSFSIVDLFSNRPLIYVTLWKSFLYVVCSILLRIVEHIIPLFMHIKSFGELWQAIVHHTERPFFWLAQCWLGYLFIIFVGYRELVISIGVDKAKNLFFGTKNDAP